MYVVTVIGRNHQLKRYGYSNVGQAGRAVLRHNRNGAKHLWINDLDEMVKTQTDQIRIKVEAPEVTYV